MDAPARIKQSSMMVKLKGWCGSCERLRGCFKKMGSRRVRGLECAVLVFMEGMVQKCWAWSDNPNWEREVEEKCVLYDAYKKEQRDEWRRAIR